jgi:small-conductance mechanosensitive channel
MKYVVLLLKMALLAALILIRLGEWDVSWLYAFSKYRSSLDYYLGALAGIAIFLLVLDFAQFFVVWWYRRGHHIKSTDNFIVGVGHLYSIVLFFGMIFSVLALFRVDIRELFTSLSIIFAGFAILTKDYISNMINGMIITFSGQLSIGDNISVGEHRGKITDITLQNIHLLNDDDDVIFIPNNLLLNGEVINYTKREIKRTSIEFEIDLKYLKNVEELERNLTETLRPFHHLIKPDSYYLRVAEVKKDLVILKFQYILDEPNKDLERQIRKRTIRHLVEIISEREKFVDKIPDLPDVVDPI